MGISVILYVNESDSRIIIVLFSSSLFHCDFEAVSWYPSISEINDGLLFLCIAWILET